MTRLRIHLLLLLLALPVILGSEEQSGAASWYGGKFQGRTTASGETFNTYDYTAAHKTLPFGTMVKVIHHDTGKSVNVRINDRGPFVEGRIIDLSYAAARDLGILKEGVAPVVIQWGEETQDLYQIQLGAFSDLENVKRLMEILKSRGLNPVSELNNQGLVRLILYDVPEDSTYRIVKSLEDLNLGQVLIRQN